MKTYAIFTRKQMYTIEAAYFKADEIGVMFFDEDDEGIGFIPTCAVEMVKEMPITVATQKEKKQ